MSFNLSTSTTPEPSASTTAAPDPAGHSSSSESWYNDDNCSWVRYEWFWTLITVIAFIALLSAILYGKHRGEYTQLKVKLNHKIWAVVSAIVLPYTLVLYWLAANWSHSSLTYLSDRDPLILPLALIYVVYSLVFSLQYAYHSAFAYSFVQKLLAASVLLLLVFFSVTLIFVFTHAKDMNHFHFTGKRHIHYGNFGDDKSQNNLADKNFNFHHDLDFYDTNYEGDNNNNNDVSLSSSRISTRRLLHFANSDSQRREVRLCVSIDLFSLLLFVLWLATCVQHLSVFVQWAYYRRQGKDYLTLVPAGMQVTRSRTETPATGIYHEQREGVMTETAPDDYRKTLERRSSFQKPKRDSRRDLRIKKEKASDKGLDLGKGGQIFVATKSQHATSPIQEVDDENQEGGGGGKVPAIGGPEICFSGRKLNGDEVDVAGMYDTSSDEDPFDAVKRQAESRPHSDDSDSEKRINI